MEVTNDAHMLVAFDNFTNVHELARSATGRYELLRKHPVTKISNFAMATWTRDLTLFISHWGMHAVANFGKAITREWGRACLVTFRSLPST